MKEHALNPSGEFDRPTSASIYTKEAKTKKLSTIAIVFMITTVLAMGTSAYLYSENTHKTAVTESLTTDLQSSEARYADLDTKYTMALADIESYKGKNADLDKLLTEKESAITTLKANLAKEKKKGALSETDYKTQLDQLNLMIVDLNTKVTELQNQNTLLSSRNDSLGKNLQDRDLKVTELLTTNSALSKKVTVASLLVPDNFSASGSFTKSSGKEDETSRASKASQLQFCFDVPVNKVADAGQKTFLIRVINPMGAVLANQSQGSGTFTDAASGESKQYSTAATFDYAQQVKSICTHWTQSLPYDVGNYTAEIYQDGYFVAKTEFELK